MVDQFAIVLTHGLLALAALRLVMRGDLDDDPVEAVKTGRAPGSSGRA